MDYLANLEFQALIFGDSVKFEGLLPIRQGWVIVTSQDFVEGREATAEEILAFFKRCGFKPLGNFSFERVLGDFQVRVRDARPANLLNDRGVIVPIDIQIFVSPV